MRFSTTRTLRTTIERYGRIYQAQQSTKAQGTQSSIKHRFERSVLPEFGDRRIGSILPSEVATWVATQSSQYAATTVAASCQVFGAILKVAMRDGSQSARRILESGYLSVPRPQKEVAIFDVDELDALWNVKAPPQERVMVRCAIELGLRQGELAAMRLDKFENRVVAGQTIRFYLVDAQVGPGGRLIPPKRGKNRLVPVSDELWSSVNLMITGHGGVADNGLLFLTRGGRPFGRSSMTDMFDRTLAAARVAKLKDGARRTLHTCRHSMASRMLARVVPVKTVATLLGHSDEATTTRVYSHLVDESMIAAAAAMASLREKGAEKGQGTSTDISTTHEQRDLSESV